MTLVTEPVDASKLVSLGAQADSRNEYWGFSPDSFPINARVWYPGGAGPFPLVLVVHGNHNPQDFSDPGYDYLGELLASRGFILASVDMNFINGGIRGENDGRGWLLLKHLQAWRDFNQDPDSPLRGKVDMDQIAVMGHSRGGEAVGHAAAFNKLEYYPDDASLEFDFGFNIRSVVAIAPVDGQYLPTNRGAPIEDVNYLVFHGSHDGDVTSFHGLRQYQRATFSGDVDAFKSAVYVYRANHGQWNSVWNSFDNGPRSPRILDLRGLLDPADQRRFAEVYVSAFLEATLKGDKSYLPLFRDHRVAGDWLPNTMYITSFEHSTHTSVADFEGDIDITTGGPRRSRPDWGFPSDLAGVHADTAVSESSQHQRVAGQPGGVVGVEPQRRGVRGAGAPQRVPNRSERPRESGTGPERRSHPGLQSGSRRRGAPTSIPSGRRRGV